MSCCRFRDLMELIVTKYNICIYILRYLLIIYCLNSSFYNLFPLLLNREEN